MHDAAIVSTQHHEGPPRAPDVETKLRLTVPQRILIPLLILVPLLTLAGAFGERTAERSATVGALAVNATVPTRFRYRQRMTLRVAVQNAGAAPVDDVRIRVDSSYLDRFSGVTLSLDPAPDGSIHAGTLGSGESVLLAASLEGDHTGRIRGDIVVTDARGDAVRIPLSSFVFP